MPKNTNVPTNSSIMVQLLNKSEALAAFGEAEQVINRNPTVTWAKFVLTDDAVNGNGQRIPADEFKNLIETGVSMPVKMAVGEISPGHPETKPIGVMTHLKEVLTTAGKRAIIALAALWSEERPADVQYLKDKFSKGEDINISWEILYGDAVYNEEFASVDLRSTVLKAAAIVGNPAYGGRTNFLSVSAVKWSEPYLKALPNEHFLIYGDGIENKYPIMDSEGLLDLAKIEEAKAGLLTDTSVEESAKQDKLKLLEDLRALIDSGENLSAVSEIFYNSPNKRVEENTLDKLEELKAQLQKVENDLKVLTEAHDALKQETSDKEASVAELTGQVETLKSELVAKDSELEGLRKFKSDLEAEASKAEKLQELKNKFAEAGIVRDAEYFEANAEKFLGMPEDVLNFLVEELKAEVSKEALLKEEASKKIPPLTDTDAANLSVKEMAKYLKSLKSGK